MRGLIVSLGIIAPASLCASAVLGAPFVAERNGNVFIWQEAELFNDKGGWTVDTQFIMHVGSAYLLSVGLGKPVADAKTTVKIPRTGSYRLWVRCKNWVPEHSPGRFGVIVAGKQSSTEFGTVPTDEWVWQDGGIFELERGDVQIIIHDLTGWYSRCDAILLTTDLAFKPPDKTEDVHKLKAELFGEPAPKELGEFDVVVIGGGVGGSCAAIAAARLGCKVALIQDRPVLGGNASSEIRVGIEGATGGGHRYARESGIVEEIREASLQHGSVDAGILSLMKREPNLTLFLGMRAVEAIMESKSRIAAAKCVDVVTMQPFIVKGKLFIDCSGDGDFAASAGAEFRMGREGRDEYGESMAPEKPDKLTLGSSLLYAARDVGKPVEFVAPPWAYKFPNEASLAHRNHDNFWSGHWWIEYGGTLDTIRDAEKIRDELLRILFGVWDHIKNHCVHSQRARNYDLVWVGHVAGKRESRRFIGDYVLKQSDLENAVLFEDRVAYGGWTIDLHPPLGIFDRGTPSIHKQVPLYSIPFRCLYSRNIENLMFAGRHISASHVAFGSTRVMATIGTMGQAVGTAAYLCLKHNAAPREIGQRHIKELQQLLLKHDAYIIGVRNEDPNDLALKARANASSYLRFETFDGRRVKSAGLHRLDHARAQQFIVSGARLEAVYVWLRNELDKPVEVVARLREAKEFGDFTSQVDLATAKATVPEKGDHWVRFDFGVDVKPQGHYWIWLPPAEGLSWHLADKVPPVGWCRAYRSKGNGEVWNRMPGNYAIDIVPQVSIDWGDLFHPMSAINGYARPTEVVKGQWQPNQWRSDPTQPMPQWLELDFGKPMTFNTVHITFDTDLDERHRRSLRVPECVRDYELQWFDDVGNQWRTILRVMDNHSRKRVHKFEPVTSTKLRILVHATNGDKSARIYEVRVYNEQN